ncbi:putative gamma interferon inducible lysosomal thiol reductase GILT [Helianthus annuus]|nr:putative gamma interferon inducible lysosomal thiol reductase GILT [Helianthus annuus]
MEAHRRNNRRSNITLFLIVSLAATLVTSSASPITVTTGDKVELSLYYEALCPYCENFILNYLYKVFDNGLISIVDLKLSPYGNAKIRSNGTIVCQWSYENDSIKDDLRNFIAIKLADYMMIMLVTAMYEEDL